MQMEGEESAISQKNESGEWAVAFESRKLNNAEQNYATYEKELLAAVHALRTVPVALALCIEHVSTVPTLPESLCPTQSTRPF